MDDWFRFIIGTVVASLTAVSGWFAHLLTANATRITELEKQVALLQQRPYVDPLKYVEAITAMSGSIRVLAENVAELKLEVANLERVISKEKSRGL